MFDAYSHFCPPSYLKAVADSRNPRLRETAAKNRARWADFPAFIDVEKRLRILERCGIDHQVITLVTSMDPPRLPLGADDAGMKEEVRLSRIVDDGMADAAEKSRGVLVAAGIPPLRSLNNGGIEEMDRAVRELGLKGFIVPTNVDGVPVDRLTKFWEEAARLKATVWLHPVNSRDSSSRTYEAEYDLMHVFGWPFETTLILSRMVFSGQAEKYAGRVNLIAHHLGGMVPFFAGRISETYTPEAGVSTRGEVLGNISKEAMDYYKLFYYDTAVGGSEAAVRCGYQALGADRIVFGTDYPYGPGGGISRLVGYQKDIKKLGLSRAEEEKISEGNIRKILRI